MSAIDAKAVLRGEMNCLACGHAWYAHRAYELPCCGGEMQVFGQSTCGCRLSERDVQAEVRREALSQQTARAEAAEEALDDIAIHAVSDIVPGWTSVPSVEFDQAMRRATIAAEARP